MRACGNTIHVAAQLAASLSILMDPFLPFAAASVRRMLGLEVVRSSSGSSGRGEIGWDDAGRPLLSAGQPLGPIEILFTKVEDEAIAKQRAKLEAAAPAAPPPQGPYKPIADSITYDDFAKLDLRVGLVTTCEPVKKSKKLLRCEVDLGFETRQILAGVALQFKPEDLIGRKVVVVANLAPRTMMGLESHGMMLMAADRQEVLFPVSADAEPGSSIR